MRPSRRPAGPSSGVSLVEMAIVVALFVVMGAALLIMLMGGQTALLSSDAALRAQEEARKALDNVVRELRGAVHITCDQTAFDPLAPNTDCTSTGSRLNFRLVWYDAGTGMVDAGSGTAVDNAVLHYAVLGTQLIRYQDASYTAATPATCDVGAGCRVVANNVSSIVFSWDGFTLGGNPATPRVLTVTLESSVGSAALPGGVTAGALKTGIITTRVKARNTDPAT